VLEPSEEQEKASSKKINSRDGVDRHPITYLSMHDGISIILSRQRLISSFGLSATSRQYFSLGTKQPSAISQQYFSLRTNQHHHQPPAK
jgi:hypothetical protein